MRRYLLFMVVLAAALIPTAVVADPPDNFLTNGSFENGFTGWTVANKSGDKIICNGTPAASNGVCVLKIKGGGVGLTLAQSASAGDIAELNTELECTSVNILPSFPFLKTGGSARYPQVTLTLKYNYGFYDHIVKAKLKSVSPNLIGTWGVPFLPPIALPQLSEVTSIKLQLQDKNTGGVIYADNFKIGWEFGSPGIC